MSRTLAWTLGVGLVVASHLDGATLFLQSGPDGNDSISMNVGGTAFIEIVLELEEGETFGFGNAFLDAIYVDGNDDAIEVQSVEGDPSFVYDRSSFSLPALIDAAGQNEYGLVMGQGSVEGPATIVLDQLTITGLAAGLVEVGFETGARAPLFSEPAPNYTSFSLAPVSLDPGFEGFLYLGTGDLRDGGAGPLVVGVDVEVPNNDNESPPPPGNDNAALPDNENDNAAPSNDNVAPSDAQVSINEQTDSELLGLMDDGDATLAVFVDRDPDGNPIRINGLYYDAPSIHIKLIIEDNLLTGLESDGGDTVDFIYDSGDQTVEMTNGSGDSVVVSLGDDIDLDGAADMGQGAVAGESGTESMDRLLGEVSSVMGPIVTLIDADADAETLLNGVGGIEVLRYVFSASPANVNSAVNEGNVEENSDFGDAGDSNIDDSFDDLAGLSQPNRVTNEPTGDTGSDGPSTSRGFCGMGMLGFSALSGFAVALVRERRRWRSV